MKICKIIDEGAGATLIGYLLYFEHGGEFSIELSDSLTALDAPIFLEQFIKKGQRTIDPVWSGRWVQSRIIPSDRQNLGMILKDNKLKEYDPYKLLMLGHGRCAQDDCAVIQTDADEAEDWLLARRRTKLDFAMTVGEGEMLSIFRDGSIWRCDPAAEGLADERLRMILERPDLTIQMEQIPGGLGVRWQSDIVLTAEQLYGRGARLPFTREELDSLMRHYVMLTSDVCSELDCSRQYVDKKVREGSLDPLRESGSTRLYTAGEVARSVE